MATFPVHSSPPPGAAVVSASPAADSGATVRTSLYVGDLSPEVTETELQQAFEAVGPLASLRLCRDRVTGQSLRYAYVNFANPHDASRALSYLNHAKLKGESMRIMWCQRDPIVRRNGVANLYVKNLVPSVTSACLEQIFSIYGTILSCKVAEENGISKGFGFVQFDSEDSAMAALNALDGTMFRGKKLCVCKFVRKDDRKNVSTEAFKNLYFKNLDEDVTEDFLKEKFSEHGTVCNLVIMKDNEGKCKGFGFVNFSSHEEAMKAVECLNGSPLGSKTLFVGKAQRKAERVTLLQHVKRNDSSNLFVKNLDVLLDDKDLESLFSPFGKITSAKVMKDENGFSKGYGFVHYFCAEEAKRAMVSRNGYTVLGKTLYVAFAKKKEVGGQHLQRFPVQYPMPSFYPSYWNVHPAGPVPQYHPLYYNGPVPLPPTPFLSQQQNLLQPNLLGGTCRGLFGVSLGQEQRYPQNLPGTAVLCGQPQQEPKLDMTHQYHPKTSASPRGWGQGKRLRKQGKSFHTDLESSTTMSGSEYPPTRSSFKLVHRNKFDKMLQPNANNTQIEDSVKRNEVIVEMDVKRLLSSHNPLSVPVEKAIQMIGATSGSQTTTYSVTRR